MIHNRRRFIQQISASSAALSLSGLPRLVLAQDNSFWAQWQSPAREFSQAPFWFWNDDLSEKEITRQLTDFCAHGVYGFVIHPRAGLPRSIGFMSDRMIHFMRHAINEAKRLDMWVVLYDEGMYPSGSASGQVVAENPKYRPRGLFAVDLTEAKPGDEIQGFTIDQNGVALKDDQKEVAVVTRKDGHHIAILDRYLSSGYALIRGLHFKEDNPKRRADKREVAEDMPPLGDILNPASVQCFIRLVYQRCYDEFKEHFGTTIKAMFTDEPSFFGKRAERGAVPGNADVLQFVHEWSGKDFTPCLPSLFYKDEPNAAEHRALYNRALQARLEETFYAPISKWCEDHGVALTGHPAAPDDIGHLRYFQIPGQDIVWRYIEPGKPNALEGAQSTNAKCASSAMIHLGRRFNSNEYCGAYGHNFTFREMQWLANWLIARGCNRLYPHAFYYSIRGPRIDERPPDVGPNNTWWSEFKPFADATSRLCGLNTDSRHVCEVAILGLNDSLPWQAAKACFQNQIDFNYLEARHLWEDAHVDEDGIHIAGMHYKALILEVEPPKQAAPMIQTLQNAGRIIQWKDDAAALLSSLNKLTQPDAATSPHTDDLRARHVVKDGRDCYLLFNEGDKKMKTTVQFAAKGNAKLLDIHTGKSQDFDPNNELAFEPHQM
ncbi:hypothetical protein K8I31_19340, partial [bacterium]|nr:hypothetical protein [bacterium]